MEDGGDLAHFTGEGDEFLGEQGLHAVGEGFVRLMMNLDEQTIGSYSDSGAGERQAGLLRGKLGVRAGDLERARDAGEDRRADFVDRGRRVAQRIALPLLRHLETFGRRVL